MTRHRATLRRLFVALDADDHWTDDDLALVEYMESTWLGHEHGQQTGKPDFTPQQEAAAMPLLDALGLCTRVEPPSDRYDEIVVMGAAGIGLHRRLELVRTSGVTADGLTVLAGLRPHERAARDGGLDELLDAEGRFAAAPQWTPPALLTRIAALLTESGVDPYDAAAIAMPHETALAELLVHKQWPSARPVRTRHLPPHAVENELGQRRWALRDLVVEGSVPVIRVLNGAPVERPNRPSRPTSRSTFLEWLSEVAPTPAARRVLVVVNQPHLGRVRLALLDLLDEVGRHDLTLEFAGCETLASGGILVHLGEIPAWIRADRRTSR